MVKRTFHFLLFLCLAVTAAHAQIPVEFTIWGRVVMPEGAFSKQGGVEVRLETPGHIFVNSTTTDDDGRFQFRSVGEGTFHLAINLEGYAPVSEPVTLTTPTGARASSISTLSQPRVTLYLRRGASDTGLQVTRRDGSEARGSAVGDTAVINAEFFKKYGARAVREYQDGLANVKKGNDDKAVGRFNKAIELEPRFYEAHMQLGLTKQRAGRLLEAGQSFQRGRELEPGLPEPLTKLGGVLLDKARALELGGKASDGAMVYEEAAEVLDKAVRLDLNSTEAHYFLGSALLKLNELQDAESNLLQAIDAPRPLHEARLMLVNVYMKQRRHREAIEQLEAYLAANPNSPQRERIEQMLQELRKSVAGAPMNRF